MQIHVKKINDKIIITQKEFKDIIDKLNELEEVEIMEDEFYDLLESSNTSIDFWNNKVDDEVWNDA
jgi:hypothetical protein